MIDSNYNEEITVTIARVRLAGVLLDEKAYDDAMKLLAGDVSEKFQPMVLDRKADIPGCAKQDCRNSAPVSLYQECDRQE